MFKLLTEYSPWYLGFCLFLGVAYAYLLYTKKAPWGRQLNYVLASVRFIIVSTLCFLLLGPYLKLIDNYFEKPIIVLAVDNSQSISLVADSAKLQQSVAQLTQLTNQIEAQEHYQTELRLFQPESSNPTFDSITFQAGQSNVSGILSDIQTDYANQNLAHIVLFSDGIYNQGASPLYGAYKTPISVLAIGDSLAKTDVNLKNIYANRIAYLNNKFPIQVEVAQTGFTGQTVSVQLFQNGKLLDSQELTLAEEDVMQTVDFLVEATAIGMQRYIARILPLDGEFTAQNNQKSVYIDILDSKEKVLLVAASPHPDIKAFRSAIEKGKNYQFDVYIPGLTDRNTDVAKLLSEKYDLIIFYQVPNRKQGITTPLSQLLNRKVSRLFVLGAQSDIRRFNSMNEAVNIQAMGNNVDRVMPFFNNRFDRFTFEDDKRSIILKYPPATVPFGEYSLRPNFEVVLYQKVGSINTNKPLLAVGESNGRKEGVLFAEGIWQWRLQEYALNENQDAFDELVGKLVQYLSSKEDKRKFKVYTTNNEYSDFETVFFETEVYNDIYELVYGQRITLTLTHDDGTEKEYVYVNSRSGFRYAINGLAPGVYKYVATTNLNGEAVSSSGEFSVQKLEIEALNTQADFGLLRQLARQTQGTFGFVEEWQVLADSLASNKAPAIVHTQENTMEIIELPWLLVLVMLLATLEWFFRKYKGSY